MAREADLSRYFPSKQSTGNPIRAICVTESDGTVTAKAPGMGLLVEGTGDSDESALRDLAEILIDQKRRLLEVPIDRLMGNALFLRLALERRISDPA